MKFAALTLMLLVPAVADIPVKKPVQDYDLLWTRSPFTGSAVSAEKTQASAESIVSGWTLLGVSQLSSGYQVTLASKTEGGKTEVIKAGKESRFSIVKIERGNGSPEDMTVTLTDGERTETLRFDKKLFARPEPKAKPAAGTAPRAILVPEN